MHNAHVETLVLIKDEDDGLMTDLILTLQKDFTSITHLCKLAGNACNHAQVNFFTLWNVIYINRQLITLHIVERIMIWFPC